MYLVLLSSLVRSVAGRCCGSPDTCGLYFASPGASRGVISYCERVPVSEVWFACCQYFFLQGPILVVCLRVSYPCGHFMHKVCVELLVFLRFIPLIHGII